VSAGGRKPSATVILERDGQERSGTGSGNGPVEAACRAIDAATGVRCALEDFSVHGITRGKDAIGQARVRVTRGKTEATGRAADVDVVVASARAYLNAVNRIAGGEGGGD